MAKSTRSPDKNPRKIQSMFGQIAPVYDFFNHFFTLNIDRSWRRETVRLAIKPSDKLVVDVACGTGDLTIELKARAPGHCQVIGLDFCLPMLRVAERKAPITFLQGDGLKLPFADSTVDLITIGFGLRNLADLRGGLAEFRRVLKPGGRLAILECSLPQNPLVRRPYLLYFDHIMPLIGNLVSRSEAYRYLNRSVRAWPSPRKLASHLQASGFDNIRWQQLTMGTVALHLAEKHRRKCTSK